MNRAFRAIPKNQEKRTGELENRRTETIQTAALWRSTRVIRRTLGNLLSLGILGKPPVTIGGQKFVTIIIIIIIIIMIIDGSPHLG